MDKIEKDILAFTDEFFNKEKSYQLAKRCGFIQRSSSKLQGHEFLKILTLPSQGLKHESLQGLCDRIRMFNQQAELTASALVQRINQPNAVEFMREALAEVIQLSRERIKRQYVAEDGILSLFKNIYIQDSTLVELHEHLSPIYPGTKRGTNCCQSQAKIDLIHNFATGQVSDLHICPGKNPDQSLAKRIISFLKEGDLVIRDLGYFALNSIKQIEEKGAYYLSRFPSHVKFYLNQEDERALDLAAYLDKHFPFDRIIELIGYIGREKIKTRIIFYRIPREELEKRQRRANKHAKETGRVQSQSKKDLMKYSIFITNIPVHMLPNEKVGTIYRLRWEVELIFKQWKSQLNIHYLEGTNKYRIQCLLLGRLCMVIIASMLCAHFMAIAQHLYQKELSPVKLLNYLLREGKFSRAVANSSVEELIDQTIKDIIRMLIKDTRALRTMRENVIQFRDYYEDALCA